ncbi:MAG: hypothetical protein NWE89_10980 [Candidatus Bathyarchaeota archaeon]|nr:hypothetical protein [Candidatus Bathyarchaeota archaeon]
MSMRINLSPRALATFLVGFVFLATGFLLIMNILNTETGKISPTILTPLGYIVIIAGLVLITSRDE